jgi:predicted site-specific integrase-resolvase
MKATTAIRDRRIVGVTKAAAYAGVSRWAIRAWILEGKLPQVKYPGKHGGSFHMMVDLDDLDKLITVIRDRRIVGVTKAAAYAGVSRWTVRAWVLEGKLPQVKNAYFHHMMVDLDDLDKFIEDAKDDKI